MLVQVTPGGWALCVRWGNTKISRSYSIGAFTSACVVVWLSLCVCVVCLFCVKAHAYNCVCVCARVCVYAQQQVISRYMVRRAYTILANLTFAPYHFR
jgi:hypothetical protein